MESVSEVWKPIKENANYEVSNLGRVRSLARIVERRNNSPRKVRERILSQGKAGAGYHFISLYEGGKSHSRYVHHLVAEAFIGPRPDDCEHNHIDGDKSNNSAANIEYVRRAENMAHAYATGLIDNEGEKGGRAKYTAEQIRDGYYMVKSGMQYRDAAARVGINQDALEAACRGVNWKCLRLTPIKRAKSSA